MIHLSFARLLLLVVSSAITGYSLCAIFNARAISVGEGLLRAAAGDIERAWQHIASYDPFKNLVKK